MKESINNLKLHEEYLITYYANQITNNMEQDIHEFKKLMYQVAILDKNNTLIYSTYDISSIYHKSKSTYVENDFVFYNDSRFFIDVGSVKVFLKKKIDYSSVKTKSSIIIITSLVFLIICSLILHFYIKNIYSNISKKLDIFFKDAIHEIRTPLGVIQINLDFLENRLEDSKPLKRAQGGLRTLTSVYESLEYSIKHTKIVYKKEDINLSQFLNNRIDFFNVLSEVKEMTMKCNIESDIYIFISRIELQRLIDNNLSNAIKYSTENTQMEILLYIKEDTIYMQFSNQGDIIKSPHLVFNRYYRDDEIKGGFGLGLSIVSNICKIYNIEFKVDSKDGHTTFLYKIPNKIAKKATS